MGERRAEPRRTCRRCRRRLPTLRALAAEVHSKPAEFLSDGMKRHPDAAYAYAFGGIEEWTLHLAAKIEGYCDCFCRGAAASPGREVSR